MVVVECRECSRKYQLDEEDNPNNYQCDCGGSLKGTSKSNMNRILLIVALVIISYFIGYLSMWMLDSINII